MKEVIFKIIDNFTEGVDTYYNNGSMWLIFTDEKKWVIELTKEGILWYNYYFFQNSFKYVSLDVVENQHYITEWVETTIQNGVKYTGNKLRMYFDIVETTIQNGVKYTGGITKPSSSLVETTIQNGVKDTCPGQFAHQVFVESIIQNGVKRTELGGKDRKIDEIKDIVENGIKETESIASHRTWKSEEVINNNIKETVCGVLEIYNPNTFEPVLREMKRMNEVDNVLEEGIKEVKELPDMSGELKGYGEYYARQKDKTYFNDERGNIQNYR